VGDLVEATAGELLRGDSETRVSSYTIDSRAVEPGGVFFALRGTRVDGHAFVADAARAGATMAVIESEPERDAPLPPVLLRVESTTAALGRSGQLARRKQPGRVVAVTGSTGKTTTKELLAEGLGASRRVHRTRGNLNNHLGVPLTLLAAPDTTEVQVIELAMSAPGEIAALALLSDPDVALVTNVRPVHLEFFRTLEDIAAAKGELFAVLRPEATAVVNLDDERVRLQAARHAGPRVTFGRSPEADLVLESIEDGYVPGAGLVFRHAGVTRTLRLRIGGSHAAWNALAALAAIDAAGEDLDAAVRAMETLEPGEGRGRMYRLSGGVFLVDDTYNSNPAAMASVLQTVRATSVPGRKIVVMGDMLELGHDETPFHRVAGEQAAAAGVDVLVGVGTRARAALEAARRAGIREAHSAEDATEAARSVRERVRPGDLVVVKGSRGVHLELVVKELRSALGEER
jgi:UDP-N-acetylmuramoyl-tripeptide--D-alanyl-D-alanine ligase